MSREVATGSRPVANAKAEVGVQVVERWIVALEARLWRDAQLRKRRFFSLAEVNAEIARLLTRLNDKVIRHLGASRRGLFEQLDKPALKPLPATPYEYAEWLERRIGLDYHVEVEKHYYSFDGLARPHLRPRSRLIPSASQEDALGAPHRRHTTVPEHMPASHRRHAGVTPGEIRLRAARVGPNTAALVEQILHAKTHPEQGFRARHCRSELPSSRHRSERRWRRRDNGSPSALSGLSARMGMRPSRPPANAPPRVRHEAATGSRPVADALSYSSIKSILKSEPTKAPPVRARRRTLHRRRPRETAEGPAITHHNIRRTKGAPLTREGAPPARRAKYFVSATWAPPSTDP